MTWIVVFFLLYSRQKQWVFFVYAQDKAVLAERENGMVKIVLNGCSGKMGGVVSGLAKLDGEVEIVAGVDPAANEGGRDYPVFTRLEDYSGEADVVVDFSSPLSTDELIRYCVERRLPLVLCTTGLSDEQTDKVRLAGTRVAILMSANMSLGINLLTELLREAAPVLAPAGFDMEIVEKHHAQEKDAPSGTALALANAMRECLQGSYSLCFDESNGKREKHTIGISPVRDGTIAGEHEAVFFVGQDEIITLSYTAFSKAVFGKGAIQAAKFLQGRMPGLYDMGDVIGRK